VSDDRLGGDAKSRLAALLARNARADRRTDPFGASLVHLHRGSGKRAFFCVHPGSGAAGCFTEIAPLVDPARPFYALQAPGVDGDCEPLTDLAALARGYVAEIRRVQPHGPYLLGGWSLGGTIAFAMAHELQACGEPVAFLGLFDTQRAEALHEARMTRAEALDLSYRQAGFATAHLAHQRDVAIDVDAATERFRAAAPRSMPSRVELMLKILVEHEVFADATHPMFRVFRANMVALGDYGMPEIPYAGELTLFRCKNDDFGEGFARVDPAYCWQRAASRAVNVVMMPSHHFALFHGRVLPETVRQLRLCLDRADP
jgi:thioesterase domain-containing protein